MRITRNKNFFKKCIVVLFISFIFLSIMIGIYFVRRAQHSKDGKFSYLAIGNSITIHSKCDYWFGEWGMAATKESNDYFHIVCKFLADKGIELNADPFNFYVWEVQSNDRAETYELLDKKLKNRIDLITIQLSENVYDISTFGSDFRSLLLYIKKHSQAQVIVIDDFWNDEKSLIKKEICNQLNIPFVSLEDIRNDDKFKAGLGTIVEGDDEKEHIIEHDGVASHPGDNAMKVIANRIIEMIEIDTNE